MIILNKGDLVNEEQQADLEEKITLLNSKAKIMKTTQSRIDVRDILNTNLYKDKDEFWVTSTKQGKGEEEVEDKVVKEGKRVPEACTARFDIKSFVYRARKPFHPGRLYDMVLEPYFMYPALSPEDEPEEGEDQRSEEEKKKQEVEREREKIYNIKHNIL